MCLGLLLTRSILSNGYVHILLPTRYTRKSALFYAVSPQQRVELFLGVSYFQLVFRGLRVSNAIISTACYRDTALNGQIKLYQINTATTI